VETITIGSAAGSFDTVVTGLDPLARVARREPRLRADVVAVGEVGSAGESTIDSGVASTTAEAAAESGNESGADSGADSGAVSTTA
jgi:hypothetical protein